MSNKFKLILIAVELFVLVVLLLLGVGCQQKWIIVTGDGPRFDWYALVETQPPIEDETENATEPASEETSEPEPSTTAPTRPEPSTEPDETTEPTEETEAPTEDTTEPTNSDGTREDELPRIPIS